MSSLAHTPLRLTDAALANQQRAADAGQIINPDGLTNQIEGGVVQSASWTLHEHVRFDRTGILSLDWMNWTANVILLLAGAIGAVPGVAVGFGLKALQDVILPPGRPRRRDEADDEEEDEADDEPPRRRRSAGGTP